MGRSRESVETYEDAEARIVGDIAALEAELTQLATSEVERLSASGPIEPSTGTAARERAALMRATIRESRIRLAQLRAEHHAAQHASFAAALKVARDAAIAARAELVEAEKRVDLASRDAERIKGMASHHRGQAQRFNEEATRLVGERVATLKGI